ncbi:hypothetical protein LINGRAHAP2_LOCUS30657, partial [Linum grandiflorum]
ELYHNGKGAIGRGVRLRQVPLLFGTLPHQEFDIEIENKKGSKNVAADHLSRLLDEEITSPNGKPIRERFLDEELFAMQSREEGGPWFADIANYIEG